MTFIKFCQPSIEDDKFMSILRKNKIPCSASAMINSGERYECIIHVVKENFEQAYQLKQSNGIKASLSIVEDTQWLR